MSLIDSSVVDGGFSSASERNHSQAHNAIFHPDREHADIERPEYMRVILGGFQIARPTEIYEEEMEDAHYSPLRNLGGRTLWYKPPEF